MGLEALLWGWALGLNPFYGAESTAMGLNLLYGAGGIAIGLGPGSDPSAMGLKALLWG